MATRMSAQHLQKLREELQKVQMEIRTLLGKESALKMAISVVSDQPISPDLEEAVGTVTRKRRSPIKDLVLKMVSDNAETGIVAADIVRLAQAQGFELDRNSVSSLLSRFKHDGVLEYDGKVYRPKRPFPRVVREAA